MPAEIAEQVIEFFDDLFTHIFSDAFRPRIADVLRRKAVIRQVEEAADAASQSLTRFFNNQQLTERQTAVILKGFAPLTTLLKLADISNPNVTPEAVVEDLLARSLPIPKAVQQAKHESVYRVALHSIVQVLMLVGPVMAEWQKLKFSSTFELPRRVLNRLNQISEQLDALGSSRQAAADERFELSYRDYLLQRFHRVEAGTVRMTTNLDVDLRELFVMPRVLPQKALKQKPGGELIEETALMNLAAARKFYGGRDDFATLGDLFKEAKENGVVALEQVRNAPRNVIVGAPGSGKSTFLEWLQLKLATVEEELVMAGQQAIPMLLRVRHLDPHNLPKGAAMIEKATASRDRATLMPAGWLDRQMKSGCVLLMLDGLDETEPDLRDGCILPWLQELCRQYPNCRYLVSSRPVGYPVGALRELEFVECDLLDFGKDEVAEYTRHWCTAIHLARNEPEEEARREGETDGKQIVKAFEGHPYINNLARNPLMLSAICLVNYFEGGQLPSDRAVLYRLCVEGLLHNWDQRRGIRSEFPLDEKLRVCREVALAMQADDRAEYEAEKVQQIFAQILNDADRAVKLLEHIRYRTGLLLERRPSVFAFAHLTFQEYLAARAVHEGNHLGIDAKRLVAEHTDGRWKEVIALYCGLASASAVRKIVRQLLNEIDVVDETDDDAWIKLLQGGISTVLAEAYLSCAELSKDYKLRKKVLVRIASAPKSSNVLLRFSPEEVAPIANFCVGGMANEYSFSGALEWLLEHPEHVNVKRLVKRLQHWRSMSSFQLTELVAILHAIAPDSTLAEIASDAEIYAATAPNLKLMSLSMGKKEIASPGDWVKIQADVAICGLWIGTRERIELPGETKVFLQILRTCLSQDFNLLVYHFISEFIGSNNSHRLPKDEETWQEFASVSRELIKKLKTSGEKNKSLISSLRSWSKFLDLAIAKKAINLNHSASRKQTKTAKIGTISKPSKRRLK